MAGGPEDLGVLIVGAGPVGLACGIAAKRLGYRYAVIEKGCLVNSIFHFPRNMGFFTTAELLEIGGHPLSTAREKPNRWEALAYYRGVARAEGLDVRTHERVLGAAPREDGTFFVSTESRDGARSYTCRWLIIATGTYDNPNRLGIPGEDLPHVSHYYEEAHACTGDSVLIAGGGNSAVEAALEIHRQGGRVTLAVRGADLKPTIKYWAMPDIRNRLAEGAIRALFHTRVVEVRARNAVLEHRDGSGALATREEAFDHVLLLTGHHPDAELLRACGLAPDPKTYQARLDPETRESRDVPGIFLAGGVAAGLEAGSVFIENGRYDCESIFRRIGAIAG